MFLDSNSDCDADSDTYFISNFEKVGVTNLALPTKPSTSVSNLNKFPTRKPFKCFIHNSRRIALKKIPILAWPTRYSEAYALFQSSSFNESGCKFPEPVYLWFGDKIRNQDSSVILSYYFRYCLFYCVNNFCTTHLKCYYFCRD